MTTPRAYIDRVAMDGSNYADVIRRGLEFTRFRETFPQAPRVFIKPNLTFPQYRPGVMTSIEAIEAAISVLSEITHAIWVGDSDSGGYNPFSMDEVYRETGIAAFAQRFGVEVVNLSKLPRESVPLSLAKGPRTVDLPRLLTREIDVLITMPVPKVHLNTGVSLTHKNQWGCIPEPNDRLRLHPYFSEVVLAVNRAVHAHFAIIDGRFGLNQTGPMKGQAVELGWVCVTNDLGAGARVMSDLMGIEVDRIPHLRAARRLGLIPDQKDIDINTDLAPFHGPQFYVKRQLTDWPGYLAFHSAWIAHLAYFSRLSEFLHWVLYLFREPFYEYGKKR